MAKTFLYALNPFQDAKAEFDLCFAEAKSCIDSQTWWAASGLLERLIHTAYYQHTIKCQRSPDDPTVTDIHFLLSYVLVRQNNLDRAAKFFYAGMISDDKENILTHLSSHFTYEKASSRRRPIDDPKLKIIFTGMNQWISDQVAKVVPEKFKKPERVADLKPEFLCVLAQHCVDQQIFLGAASLYSRSLNQKDNQRIRMARWRALNMLRSSFTDQDIYIRMINIDYLLIAYGSNTADKRFIMFDDFSTLIKNSVYASDHFLMLKYFCHTFVMSLVREKNWRDLSLVITASRDYYKKHRHKFSGSSKDVFHHVWEAIDLVRRSYAKELKANRAFYPSDEKIAYALPPALEMTAAAPSLMTPSFQAPADTTVAPLIVLKDKAEAQPPIPVVAQEVMRKKTKPPTVPVALNKHRSAAAQKKKRSHRSAKKSKSLTVSDKVGGDSSTALVAMAIEAVSASTPVQQEKAASVPAQQLEQPEALSAKPSLPEASSLNEKQPEVVTEVTSALHDSLEGQSVDSKKVESKKESDECRELPLNAVAASQEIKAAAGPVILPQLRAFQKHAPKKQPSGSIKTLLTQSRTVTHLDIKESVSEEPLNSLLKVQTPDVTKASLTMLGSVSHPDVKESASAEKLNPLPMQVVTCGWQGYYRYVVYPYAYWPSLEWMNMLDVSRQNIMVPDRGRYRYQMDFSRALPGVYQMIRIADVVSSERDLVQASYSNWTSQFVAATIKKPLGYYQYAAQPSALCFHQEWVNLFDVAKQTIIVLLSQSYMFYLDFSNARPGVYQMARVDVVPSSDQYSLTPSIVNPYSGMNVSVTNNAGRLFAPTQSHQLPLQEGSSQPALSLMRK